MSLTKAQKETLEFIKQNEVFLDKEKTIHYNAFTKTRKWNKTFDILLQNGHIYKASLRTNNVRIKAL